MGARRKKKSPELVRVDERIADIESMMQRAEREGGTPREFRELRIMLKNAEDRRRELTAQAEDDLRHVGRKWLLYTSTGSQVLGAHHTRAEALAQERAVQASKHRAEDEPHTERRNRAQVRQNRAVIRRALKDPLLTPAERAEIHETLKASAWAAPRPRARRPTPTRSKAAPQRNVLAKTWDRHPAIGKAAAVALGAAGAVKLNQKLPEGLDLKIVKVKASTAATIGTALLGGVARKLKARRTSSALLYAAVGGAIGTVAESVAKGEPLLAPKG